MDASTLRTELAASAYRDDGKGQSPGTYHAQGGKFIISSRGYVDVDGRVAPRQLEVSLSGGQIASVRDANSRKAVKAARLDPARIATLYGQKQEERRLVRVEETPELLVTGLQAVEDRDFSRHHGIDLSGIARAIWVTVRSGGQTRQGASTLTQQLARSGLLGIGKEQTVTRKFNEVLYALIMEARYDKRTILEAYLNQVYLGQRGSQAIHGMSSGAEFWFGRDLSSLNSEHIALLIGLVKGPSYYDPRRNPERALERRNFVLGKLHQSKLIDDAEFQRATAAPLGVPKTPGLVAANRFPAYIDLVRRQLGNDYAGECAAGRRAERVHRHVALGAGLRRRFGGAHDQVAGKQASSRAAGRGGADRRAQRRRAGGGRQPQCVRTRIQSRHRGAAPGGLAAQAVRLPAGIGPAGPLFAGQLGGRCAGHGAAQPRQALDARQLGQPQPRHRAPDRRAGQFLQPGHGPTGHGRWVRSG